MKKFNLKQITDLTTIMGLRNDMLPLLPLFRPRNHLLSPWENEFAPLFKRLGLKKGVRVLDAPCGQGGVSVPLSKRYGVKVTGYDIVPAYIRYSRELARKSGVDKLCRFKSADIRSVVCMKNSYDLFIWVGAPHVWGGTKSTVQALRKPVKEGGLIFIADAYLHRKTLKTGFYRRYEYLKDLKKNLTAWGDRILHFHDYKNTLWDHDRKMVYEEVLSAYKNSRTKKDYFLLSQLSKTLESAYPSSKYEIGLYVAILDKRAS